MQWAKITKITKRTKVAKAKKQAAAPTSRTTFIKNQRPSFWAVFFAVKEIRKFCVVDKKREGSHPATGASGYRHKR